MDRKLTFLYPVINDIIAPDVIFMDPNNKSFVKEDMDANPDYYKQLKAFGDNNVYTCIGYNWYHTNVEIALADTYYVASILYPEQFKDIDPKEKAKEIFKTFIGQGEARSQTVVMGVRVPRVTTAILVGAVLAITGVVMQSVLKNPLASASTLGVSNGASFGATIAIIVFSAGVQNSTSAANAISVTNPFLVSTCAFIGGISHTLPRKPKRAA